VNRKRAIKHTHMCSLIGALHLAAGSPATGSANPVVGPGKR
jgi:hypothetical protein